VGVALGAFVLALVLLVISLIAEGAMARATADVARGRPITLGEAWSVGRTLLAFTCGSACC